MPLNVQKVKWDLARSHQVAGEARGQAGALGADSESRGFAEWVLSPPAQVPPISTRRGLQAVLFDLDGVLVDTAEFHYQAWQQLADELGLPFSRQQNQWFRGVGRMECLEKLLGGHAALFAGEEKQMLAERKNAYYLDRVKRLKPADLLPGVRELIGGIRGLDDHGGHGVRLAVVSASRNARLVLELLGIAGWFDIVIDGGQVTRGKPDPQGFLLAAERLRVRPARCVVVEDAESGVRGGRAAGMKTVGIGDAAGQADVVSLCVAGVHAGMLEKLVEAGQ
jgi:alpha,alpha-trehalose phosphorylase